MRVLHLYAGNLYGGVERLLVALAGASRGAGMEVAFALAFEGRLAEELRAAGAEVAVFGPARMRRPWEVRGARRRLGALLGRTRPDAAVCHSAWTHGLFAPEVRRAGVPLAFWLHDAAAGRGWAERLARRVHPDAGIATSAFAGGTMGRLWPHLRAGVVYPPVPSPLPDPAARVRLRAELRASPADVVVLQASRMEPWKGHAVLLEALGRLAGRGGWTCWIAGGGDRPHERRHARRMRALAARLGIAERVRFLGPRRDVAALMAAADVFCQPNLGAEPFGIAFVEAMHAGRPVVGAALGGTCEVVDASVGLLVAPADPAALAGTLDALVGDAALRQRLGAAGPARAAALSDPARQAARLRQILAPLAGGGS